MFWQVFSRRFSDWANLKLSQKVLLGFPFLLMLMNNGFQLP